MTKQFWVFYLLCFLLLALVPILSFLPGLSMDFGGMGRAASEQTGIEWNSNLINVLRLAVVEPGLLLLILGSSVPMLAGLVTLLIYKGGAGWKQRLSRLLPAGQGVEAQSAVIQYALMIGIMVFGLVLVFILRGALGFNYEQGGISVSWVLPFAIIISALFDQGALLEEAGWRGFGTTLLQETMTPFKAALVIGLAWGLWHVPRDVTIGLPSSLGLVNYLALYLPAFCLGTVSVSVIAAYFMNKLGGSLIPAILIHGLANDAFGIAGTASIDIALTFDHQITKAIPYTVFAAILLVLAGKELGRPSSQS